MNKIRRNKINNILVRLESIKEEVNGVIDEEQEYLDNMPENLQDSERADIAQNAIDNLEEAADLLGDVIDNLNEAMQ